jgi:hypothetical protein
VLDDEDLNAQKRFVECGRKYQDVWGDLHVTNHGRMVALVRLSASKVAVSAFQLANLTTTQLKISSVAKTI